MARTSFTFRLVRYPQPASNRETIAPQDLEIFARGPSQGPGPLSHGTSPMYKIQASQHHHEYLGFFLLLFLLTAHLRHTVTHLQTSQLRVLDSSWLKISGSSVPSLLSVTLLYNEVRTRPSRRPGERFCVCCCRRVYFQLVPCPALGCRLAIDLGVGFAKLHREWTSHRHGPHWFPMPRPQLRRGCMCRPAKQLDRCLDPVRFIKSNHSARPHQ